MSTSMSKPRRICPSTPWTSSCWIWACPMPGTRCGAAGAGGGAAHSAGRAHRDWTMSRWPRKPSGRRAGLPDQGPDRDARPVPSLRYAIERKIMEEALFAEKERAQVTLNCIGDAVVCTDIRGNITFLNLVAEKMTGWSLLEAAGRPMTEVFRTWDAAQRRAHRNHGGTGDSADPRRASAAELHPDPARRLEIPIEDSIAPIHDREGERDRRGDRVSRRERRAGDGAADSAFGRARFSDRAAQSNAAERPHRPGHRLGAAPQEASRGAVPGSGRLQAHQ